MQRQRGIARHTAVRFTFSSMAPVLAVVCALLALAYFADVQPRRGMDVGHAEEATSTPTPTNLATMTPGVDDVTPMPTGELSGPDRPYGFETVTTPDPAESTPVPRITVYPTTTP